MPNYAGAIWLQEQFTYIDKTRKEGVRTVSPFGRDVADLLGELVFGLYHLEQPKLYKADWTATDAIAVTVAASQFATTDSDQLTRLVFLAHHLAIRVAIDPLPNHNLRIWFHRRNRDGDRYERHPTLAQAVANFEANCSLEALEEMRSPPISN